MLSLISSYATLPEKTVAKLLSNDLLINSLRYAKNDEQFQKSVDSAIASENQALLEESVAKEKQIESLKTDKERAEKELEKQKQVASVEATEAQEIIYAKDKEIEALAASKRNAEAEAKATSVKLNEMETRTLRTTKCVSIVASVFLILLFEFLINTIWRWDWLLNHNNSYGLQGCICLIFSCGNVGCWVKPWRKYLWASSVFLGLLGTLFQLLGGPTKSH